MQRFLTRQSRTNRKRPRSAGGNCGQNHWGQLHSTRTHVERQPVGKVRCSFNISRIGCTALILLHLFGVLGVELQALLHADLGLANTFLFSRFKLFSLLG